MTGCLLLNKNPGISSFESLRPIKKALKTPKVCHTGTLDSFAQGLLIVLTGRAVKLSSLFTGCDKQYQAVVRFGEETDTLDPEGKITDSAPLPKREALEAALPAFTGEILQAPPSYSAIHINGKRAYELARAGIEVTMKKRPVTVFRLSLLSWDPPHAELEVHCSSGTYIRSLVRDLALAAGSRAHLRFLKRTRVGNFSLDKALSLPPKNNDDTINDPIENPAIKDMINKAVAPLNPELFAQLGIPSISIDEKTAKAVSHGGDLRILRGAVPGLENYANAALFGPRSLAALVEQKNGLWNYRFVYAAD